MSDGVEGGCLCGSVRYKVAGVPEAVALCHCPTCRRAAGAPAVAWAMFPGDQLTITRGQVAHYASSDGVERGFCAGCGTTLTFTADFMPDLVDVTVASFDDPERLSPSMHIWESRRLAWLELADSLPRHAEFPPM